ncbi:hypothetical protein [Streptomyces sp. NPDC058964]|uniref:hypothetical protein n=1 Tax=Streptomyces sp. NPDC058964 TaxID=3346681 RepID=UPI003680A1B2
MPQVSVGHTRPRRPALALLLGVALILLAHLVACAAHAAEERGAAAGRGQGQYGSAALPLRPAEPASFRVTGTTDEQPDHDMLCCDPAHALACLRAPVGTLLLALLPVVLLSLRHRSEDAASPGAPPGRAGAPDTRARSGPALLRIVCVSRT